MPEGPRSRLLADPDTAGWHTFAMGWDEHVGWIAPMRRRRAFTRPAGVFALAMGRGRARWRLAAR